MIGIYAVQDDPENLRLHQNLCENLRSHKLKFLSPYSFLDREFFLHMYTAFHILGHAYQMCSCLVTLAWHMNIYDMWTARWGNISNE
jgi:hypothetical protein